jgi:multidrug efflux pump subunit AcrA (membrane-fusion protein)
MPGRSSPAPRAGLLLDLEVAEGDRVAKGAALAKLA